jgi:hypothetical protein
VSNLAKEEKMSASLSPRFLTDLAQVYAALRPAPLSEVFVSDLKRVYGRLAARALADLPLLANCFQKWRKTTQDLVRIRCKKLHKNDPLLCPISLFRTMDYGRLEIAHTRVLAWLLDPRKDNEHGFGDKLLAALLGWCADRCDFRRLVVDHVTPEYTLEESTRKGRLDVLAQGHWENAGERVSWMLVIEAKIDAWEAEGQLRKYDKWLLSQAKGREVYRIFLTAGDLGPTSGCDEWQMLSFLKLAQIFRRVYYRVRYARGFHFLRFYLAGVLQDICHFPRNIEEETADPYSVASYLTSVLNSQFGEPKP